MLNKVMIIGRLGVDPELRYTANGSPVCSLRVATDESYTDREGNRVERTEWHRISVFQKSAENCKQYLRKGSLVYVEGKLQTRKWQDQNGQDRYSTEIRADRIQFLDRRNSENTGEAWGHPAQTKTMPPTFSEEDAWGESGQRAETGHGYPQRNKSSMSMADDAGADDTGPVFPSEVNKASSTMDDIPF